MGASFGPPGDLKESGKGWGKVFIFVVNGVICIFELHPTDVDALELACRKLSFDEHFGKDADAKAASRCGHERL